ncbi:MAG: hypothetical protein OEV78_09220 [Spirochaetia bacterium]|nr:hypothetical protein [Spirochaetia bacterium]
MKQKILYIIIFIGFSNAVYSISEPRVLVMDIKNVSGDPNYAYLEPSITEAVIKTLKKTFVFQEFSEKDWKALAKANFFFEDSFHTPTIGMQLGLLGRQDVVIGGGYTIQNNKIIAKIHILGMADKKILKAFEVEGYADNRIWDSVQKIADTIAATAKDVLPNKEEWSSLSIQGRNQITASAYISPFPFPAARKDPLPSGTSFNINPNDFGLTFKFSLDYMRIGLFFPNTAIWGNAAYSMANANFPAQGHTPINKTKNTVAGRLDALQFSAGIGYRVLTVKSFYLLPRIGAGFYTNWMMLDFTGLSNPAEAPSSTTDIKKISYSLSGITFHGQLIIGYQLFEWLTTEIMTEYEHIFFKNSFSSNIYFSLNIGAKF